MEKPLHWKGLINWGGLWFLQILSLPKFWQPTPKLKKYSQRWGGVGFDSFGNIDKPAIGRIVFKKDSERKWIENLLHPIVRSLWTTFIQSCSSEKCLVELPLLFENNLHTQFTCVVTMYASNSTIYQRLYQRGLSLEEANARISSQLPLVQKVNRADFVLWGGGTNDF